MNKAILFIAIFLLIFALIIGAVWFFSGKQESNSPEDQIPVGDLTKSSGDTNPGNVAVDVTLVTNQNASEVGADKFNLEKQLVFYVQMNTHSVDISALKMDDISFLAVDGKRAKASKWESATEGGGHHRSGFLVFDKTSKPEQLKLVIKGIPNIAEREFSWKL